MGPGRGDAATEVRHEKRQLGVVGVVRRGRIQFGKRSRLVQDRGAEPLEVLPAAIHIRIRMPEACDYRAPAPENTAGDIRHEVARGCRKDRRGARHIDADPGLGGAARQKTRRRVPAAREHRRAGAEAARQRHRRSHTADRRLRGNDTRELCEPYVEQLAERRIPALRAVVGKT